MADQKVIQELEAQLREGRAETNRMKRLRMGRDMLEAHHEAASAEWSDGELSHFGQIYFEQHRDQYPGLDEVCTDSSSDPLWYAGELCTTLMRWYADLAGRPLTYSQAFGHLEKRANYWLQDVVDRRKHGSKVIVEGAKGAFPGTRVD